eukprot:5181026-Pyramimonas_sp.AAC.1
MGYEVVADSPGDRQCDSLSSCHALKGNQRYRQPQALQVVLLPGGEQWAMTSQLKAAPLCLDASKGGWSAECG